MGRRDTGEARRCGGAGHDAGRAVQVGPRRRSRPIERFSGSERRTRHIRAEIGPARLLLGLALAWGLAWPAGVAAQAGAASLIVPAEADARVEEAQPEINLGVDPGLRADGGGGPEVRSYLRFAVEGVTDDLRQATLRLYATSSTEDGPTVYETETEWTEGELTWDARPSRTSDAIDDRRAIEADAWVEYDVTNFVTTDGVYAFVLVADGGDGVDFSAREGARPPELVLTLDWGRAEAERSDSAAAAGESVTVVAAGDIACDPASGSFKDGLGTASNCRQEHTARLVEAIDPALILGLGDMQYEEGTLDNYEKSYDPSWGRFKDKTLVVAGGSHDFYGGGDFYEYWGERAGPAPLRNWFSRDVGAWHLVFLNSYCDEVGGCGPGSPQYEWLRADLAASDAACTLALWHEPRFTSGSRHGDDEDVDPFWDLLYDGGAEVVLVGHEHSYERFAPMDGDGDRDDALGVREFVVGTGGKSLGGAWEKVRPASEVRQEKAYGVLRLTLRPDVYDWKFVAEPGQSFTDAGSGECHGAPASGAVARDRSPLTATRLLQSITLPMVSPTRRDDAALSFSSSSRRRVGRWDARAAGGRNSAVGRNHRRSPTRGTSAEQPRTPPRPALRGQAATAPAATWRSQTRRGRRSADLSRPRIIGAASAAAPDALARSSSRA